MNGIRRIAALLAVLLTAQMLVASSSTSAVSMPQEIDLDAKQLLLQAATTVSISNTSATTIASVTSRTPETTRTPATTKVPETISPVETTKAPETAKPTETTTAPIITQAPVTTTTPTTTTTAPATTTAPTTTTTAPVTTMPPATTTSAPPVTSVPNEEDPPVTEDARVVTQYEDFKAMWISQYDLYGIYTQNKEQRSESDYTKRIQEVLDNVKALGFNTVILQVRPNADSMYPSEYYPMCQYVVGKYGREAKYDPVAIFVEEAHQRSLSVHAWINPLRAMTDAEILLVDEKYLIRQWHDDPERNGTYLVLYKGRYYLNPAYEEVRNLIIDGATEALTNYHFDGLHMDDYFYPTTDPAFDAVAYSAYTEAGGALDLGDFRREQINLLVAGLYAATKSVNPNLRYGISPAGNYDSVYSKQYADFYTWCGNEGYIDYICPQIYYGLEHQYYPFGGICEFFSDLILVDSVDLVIGMAFGKAKSQSDKWAGTGQNEWVDHKDVMMRSLKYTAQVEHCTGIAVFCYQYFYNPVTGVMEDDIAEERDNFLPVLKEITWNESKEADKRLLLLILRALQECEMNTPKALIFT